MQLIIVKQLEITSVFYNMYGRTWSVTVYLLHEICINHSFLKQFLLIYNGTCNKWRAKTCQFEVFLRYLPSHAQSSLDRCISFIYLQWSASVLPFCSVSSLLSAQVRGYPWVMDSLFSSSRPASWAERGYSDSFSRNHS